MALYTVHMRARQLTGTTVQTLVQVTSPSGGFCYVVGWGISFEGVTAANEPVLVDLLRQTTAGTASSFTPVELNEGARAASSTAQNTFTAEPTAGDILHPEYVDPEGAFSVIYEERLRPVFSNGGRVGLRGLANDTVNATAWLTFEEL